MKTENNCTFFLEPAENVEGRENVLAVFNIQEKSNFLLCYSLNDGYSSAEISYLKTLKLADKRQASSTIEALEKNYGLEINNVNPF